MSEQDIINKGIGKEKIMSKKKIFSVVTLALALLILAGFQGASKVEACAGDMPGCDISDYEILLDPNCWLGGLDPALFGDIEEGQEIREALNEGLGLTGWEKISVEATRYGGTISVRSIVEYTGNTGTLSAASIKVPSTESRVLTRFSSDNILGLCAIGNLPGEVDAVMDWVLDSDAFVTMMGKATGEEEFEIGWNMFARPMVNAMRQVLREEVFPYMQDEAVIAAYYNPDFVGWRKIYDADYFTEGSPIRVICAFSLAEPGIAGSVNDIIKASYVAVTEGMGFGFSSEYDPSIDILLKKWDGYDIYYVDTCDFFQLAWAEYQGVVFISDLDTIENLDCYYMSGNSIKVTPRRYNSYCAIDIDNIVEKFIKPFEVDLKEEMKNMSRWEDDVEYDVLEWVLSVARCSGRLGMLESWSFDQENQCVTILNMNKATGPLLLEANEIIQTLRETFINDFPGGGFA